MAVPRQEPPKPAQRQAVQKEPAEQVSEEMQAVGLFEEMLKKIGEMYTAALGLENTPELADILGAIGVVRVKIEQVMEKLKLEAQMKADAEVLEKGEEEVEHG